MSKLITLSNLTTFWTKAKAYIDNALTNKVTVVTGKGLSTNDLTDALKGNYDTAYTHSQNADVHVTAAQKTAWDAKSTFSGSYADLTNKPTIPSTVAELTDASTYALKSDLTSVYKYKGSVATVDALPTTATDGDVYNVEADGMNYAWNGAEWDALGGSVTIETATTTEIDSLFA